MQIRVNETCSNNLSMKEPKIDGPDSLSTRDHSDGCNLTQEGKFCSVITRRWEVKRVNILDLSVP